MKNWKRLLALFLSGAMALSLFACGSGDVQHTAHFDGTSTDSGKGGFWDFFSGLFGGKESTPPSAEVSGDPDASPEIVADLSQGVLEFSAGMSSGDVLLTVNGDEIPADLFLYLLAMNCDSIQMYLPFMGKTLEEMSDALLEDTLDLAAYHALLRQKAAELGCLLTDDQMEQIRTNVEDTDLDSFASYFGLSPESIEYIISINSYYDNVLAAATHDPSAEELEDYLTAKGVFAVKHILLKTTDDSNQPLPDDEIAGKKSTAEDLLSQLQAASDLEAKFDELMNEYSEDGGLATNPDGYVFDSTDSLVGGFREAALALKEGELSGIVETDYGCHIMLRLPLTDEAKAGYKESYRPDTLEDLADQWIAAADITRSDALSTLNTADFYTKLTAYQQALAERDAPPESAAPIESGGVG